jgi:hypothetical protein
MAKEEQWQEPGVFSGDFETIKAIDLGTIPVGSLSTLKEFQDTHKQVLFTPAIPYAWAYEQHIGFDPVFSDLPARYHKLIRKLSLLPEIIVDGFYGNQAYWNKTLWTIPEEAWVAFCKHIGGKAFFDTKEKLVVFFSVGLCNGEDVLAKVKGKNPGFIPVAHIDVHTNKYSISMSESVNTTTLSLAKLVPDPQIKMFAERFLKEDSSIIMTVPSQARLGNKIKKPESVGLDALTAASKKRFLELSAYYRKLFDNRESQPSDEEM